MIKINLIAFLSFVIIGCAGPNPNPGERTTDMAWYQANYARAVEFATPKAETGEPWAQLRLGIFYSNGWGVEKNLEAAESWYKKAAAQEAQGPWAEGILVGGVGKPGYFNQNSDALLAQFNLAQMYAEENRNIEEAHKLILNVIEKSQGQSIFFCCEFDGGRSFTQGQFQELKSKIEGIKNGAERS